MPEFENGSQRDVHLPVREITHIPGVQDEFNQLGVDLYRLAAGIPVDGAQVVHAVVFVVDIQHSVPAFQKRIHSRSVLVEFRFLVQSIAVHLSHRIEIGSERDGMNFLTAVNDFGNLGTGTCEDQDN